MGLWGSGALPQTRLPPVVAEKNPGWNKGWELGTDRCGHM